MSDLNEKYKNMLNKDPIFDVDQDLNKDLHEYNKQVAQDEIDSQKEPVLERELNIDNEYQYGATSNADDNTDENNKTESPKIDKKDEFKISKDNIKKAKKKPEEKSFWELLIARLVLVVLVAIVALGICFYFAQNYKPEQKTISNTTEQPAQNQKKSNYKKVSLDDTYYINPIRVYRVTIDDLLVEDGYNRDQFASYLQIDGLKNQTIEDRINTILKDSAYNLVNSLKELMPEHDSEYIHSYCVANYNNLFSFYYYGIINKTVYNEERGYDEIDEQYTKKYSATINLANGEVMFLPDIIDEGAIKNVLLTGSYRSFALNHSDYSEEDWNLYPSESASQIEEEQYELVYEISKNYKKFQTYVDSTKLHIEWNGDITNPKEYLSNKDYEKNVYSHSIDIPMANFYDKIVLFNTTKGDNLYDGKYESVGPFAIFTENRYAVDRYYQKGDNYLIDFTVGCYDESIEYRTFPREVRTTIDNYCNEYIESFIRMAKQDTGSYYVLSGNGYIGTGFSKYNYDTRESTTYEDAYHFNGSFSRLITTKDKFYSLYYPQTMEQERTSESEGDISMGIMYHYSNFDTDENDPDFGYHGGEYDNIDLGIDNLGNIITDNDEDKLPQIED